MTDSANGLTSTLQTVQTGDGDNSPLQMSLTQVNITGSLTVNGQPISVDTGSLVTKTEFNSYTSSVDLRFDGIELETGSLQNQINGLATTSSLTSLSSSIAVTDLNQNNVIAGLATTGSLSGYTTVTTFNNYTGSNDARVNSLISQTGSYVTETESGSFVTNVAGGAVSFEDQIIVTKGNGSTSTITVNNVTNADSSSFSQYAVSASYAPDNSNRNGLINTGSIGGTQSITGSLDISGTLTATSASITYLETVYETASIIYSSGSNQFGDASNDTQTLWGTVNLPSGPFSVTGNTLLNGNVDITTGNLNVYSPQARFVSDVIVTGSVQVSNGITGSLEGTASYANNANSASFAPTVIPDWVATTGSNTFTGTQTILNDVTINSSNPFGTFVNMISTGQTSFNMDSPLTQFQTNGNLVFANTLAGTGSSNINFNLSNGGDLNVSTDGFNITNPTAPGLINLQVESGSFTKAAINLQAEKSFIQAQGDLFFFNTWDANSSGSISFNSPNQINFLATSSVTISGSNNVTIRSSNVNVTGSLVVNGNQTITGSLLGSTLNDGQIRIFSDTFNSGAVKMNISSSNPAAQSNIIFGFAQGAGVVQLTGSIVISGSNNIIMGGPRPNTLVTAGTYGYVGGSTNIFGGQSTLNTGSSYRPAMNSNLNFGTIAMNLGSGSGNFNIGQNALFGGQLILNMPSASIGGNMATNIIAGQVTLQQSQAIPLASSSVAPAFSTNNVNGTFNLQTNSGSFQVLNNNINGNNIQVTSSYRSTAVGTNAVTFNNNSINGLNHRILFDGVSLGAKGLSNSLIVGANNTASMVLNDANGISSTGLIGQGLHVESGNVSGTGGSLIAGRYNGTGSLSNPGFIKFAVGTGNSNTNRRTTLWVDETSKVGMSGSLEVTGSVLVSGSVNIQGGSTVITGSNVNVGGGTISISGSQLTTNNYVAWNGSPNDAGAMSNFVGAFMVNRNAFVFNNIVQAQLTSGSNFSINTDVGSNVTRQTYSSTWGGTEAKILVENQNGTRRIDLNADNLYVSGALNVGVSNNVGRINTYGGSQWLYRDGDSNTVVGNANGVGTGFFAGSEKNMIFNGFSTPFATGSNNVIIQGAGDNFISGSGNLFIGSHNGHAGGSKNLLLGSTSYSSGSVFDDKFELGTQNSSRIFHKQGTDPLQIGYDTQVTGSLWVNGNKQFNVGTFYDTTTQSGSAAVSQSINYNTTDISQGVSVTSGTRLTVANSGTYNIQFSAQLLADTGADNVWIWLKKNGTNVSDSAGKLTLDNNQALIATWNYVVNASASDYFEIVWQNANGDAVILAETASGNVPGIPSIITTVTQVR
jgi:hypothetical protein